MIAQTPPDASARPKAMIADLALGAEVDDIFLIASATQGQARNGPYWRVEFRDASGSIGGKIWSPLSQNYPELPSGALVQVKGRVSSYRDQRELSIEHLRLLDDEESAAQDLALFMPASPYDPQAMLGELLALAEAHMPHKPWRDLIRALLTDAEIAPALLRAPAAKSMHHAYAGGLLEHTLSVCRLCLRFADHYPYLDRQTLLAGAVCHDLGKLWELSPGLATDYTQAGKLLGHINILLDRLGPFIDGAGLEPELAEHLRHLILSHHGSYEFGSPRLPATAEAFALHYADVLDAKLQQVENALSGLEVGGWSPYVPALERSLFRAAPSPEPATPPEAVQDADAAAAEAPEHGPQPHAAAQIAPSADTKAASTETKAAPSVPGPEADGLPPAPEAQGEGEAERSRNASAQAAHKHPLSLFSQCSLLLKE